jgi:hypothetical protein
MSAQKFREENLFLLPKLDVRKKFMFHISSSKIYFGQASASDFTLHKNEARKKLYIKRHEKNESKFWNKSGIDTASFWARFLLWEKPTLKESYEYIKNKYL